MNDIENAQPEPHQPTESAAAPTAQEPLRVYVPAQPAPPRRRGWLPVVGGLAAGAVFGAVAGGVGGFVVAQNAGGAGNGGVPSSPQMITVNDLDDVNVITAVAANAIDSVVTLSVTANGVGSGSGSGVVLNSDGYIVTNTHVVTLGGAAADPTIRVTTSAGRVYDAKLIGTDPLLDLAVIQVTGASELVPIKFADSSQLNVGDVTIAIGSPLGYAGTVTSGIVSAVDRSITVQSSAAPEEDAPDSGEGDNPSNPFDNFRFDLPGVNTTPSRGSIQIPVVQTDTAINPGNSGGALLDATGSLIGVNVAIAGSTGGNVGVGFAIPSNVVARISAELIENGVATHGLLGVNVVDVASDPNQTNAGIIGASVQSVVDGSGAAAAGIKVGDIIVDFGGVPITSRNDLTAQVRTHAIGDVVDVVYVRGGQSNTVSVTLGDLSSLSS